MKESESRSMGMKIDLIKNKISTRFQKSKELVASYLNEKVNKLSEAHKRTSLILFVAIMIAICGAMVVRSANDASMSLRIEQLTPPKDIYPNDGIKRGFRKVLRIKALLDSLRRSPGGIPVYDSLLHARPGLMDSLQHLIKRYKINYSN